MKQVKGESVRHLFTMLLCFVLSLLGCGDDTTAVTSETGNSTSTGNATGEQADPEVSTSDTSATPTTSSGSEGVSDSQTGNPPLPTTSSETTSSTSSTGNDTGTSDTTSTGATDESSTSSTTHEGSSSSSDTSTGDDTDISDSSTEGMSSTGASENMCDSSCAALISKAEVASDMEKDCVELFGNPIECDDDPKDNHLTKAEAAKLIYNFLQEKGKLGECGEVDMSPYKDVKPDIWYTKFVAARHCLGLFQEMVGENFCPGNLVCAAWWNEIWAKVLLLL